MQIDPLTLIEQIAAEHPGTRRLLCQFGVDVMTDGGLTLRQAALRQGVPVQEAIRVLEPGTRPEPGTQDWLKATKTQLATHIVSHHHVHTRSELTRLGHLMATVVDTEAAAHPEVVELARHFANLEKDLLAHFQMEEKNLFPAIRAAEHGGPVPISLSTPEEQLQTILAEHQAAEELVLNIRAITDDYTLPKEAGRDLRTLYLGLRELEDDLHLHLYLENHLLYPRVLPGEDW
jgi:regulator of cell morphogenesis and NO signaling